MPDTAPTSFVTDYTKFADPEQGLLPYLASSVKELIRAENDDGLQQLVNDISFVSDSLCDLNDEIIRVREEYEQMKIKRDAIRKALEEKRNAEEEIEAEMARRFGIKTSREAREESTKEIPDLGDGLDKLIDEADAISNSDISITDVNDDACDDEDQQQSTNDKGDDALSKSVRETDNDTSDMDSEASAAPEQSDRNESRQTVGELSDAHEQVETVEANNASSGAVQQQKQENAASDLDVDPFAELNEISIGDSNAKQSMINSGVVFDDGIDEIADNNEQVNDEYNSLTNTVDTEDYSNKYNDDDDENSLPSNALYADDEENNDQLFSMSQQVEDSPEDKDDDYYDDDIIDMFSNDYASDIADDYSDMLNSDDSTENNNNDNDADDEDIFGDDDFHDKADTQSSKEQQNIQHAPATKPARPKRGNAFLDADIFS